MIKTTETSTTFICDNCGKQKQYDRNIFESYKQKSINLKTYAPEGWHVDDTTNKQYCCK